MRSLRELDLAHVWHPFTAMSAYAAEQAPIIVAAEGFRLVDQTGRRYLDGHSSLWCNIHGHRVPELDAALTYQLKSVAHSTLLGLANEPSIALAAALVDRAPHGLQHVFYTDCGAAGVEAALKIAWQYHRQRTPPQSRSLFVCLESAYHGDTVGAISLGGIDPFHSLFGGMMFPVARIAGPAASVADAQRYPIDERPSPTRSLEQLERLLAERGEEVVAVVLEPLVQAAAGILVHLPSYLQAVRTLTEKYGVLLIADEIAVGFGRTGTLFACEQAGITPDILVLSKGLTGGYLPLAATLVTAPIYKTFLGEPHTGRAFLHGHTYTGNPLACAVALASLERMESANVLANARELEATLRTALADVTTLPGGEQIAAVRQCGTMVGIELLADVAHGRPYRPEVRAGHQLTLACRDRGLILRNIGDTLVLMPAPAMPRSLVLELCSIVREALAVTLPALPRT